MSAAVNLLAEHGCVPEPSDTAVDRLARAAAALPTHTGGPRYDPFAVVTANLGVRVRVDVLNVAAATAPTPTGRPVRARPAARDRRGPEVAHAPGSPAR